MEERLVHRASGIGLWVFPLFVARCTLLAVHAPRLKARHLASPGFPVVGADILADVAAEDVPAQGGAELFRDGVAELDGQIAQAAPRVHDIRFDERARGTGFERSE